MEFGFIAGEGPFYNLLIDYFDRHAKLNYVTSRFMRALLRPASDVETYMRTAFHCQQRHELRRLERRLSEAGRVEYLSLETRRRRRRLDRGVPADRGDQLERDGRPRAHQ